MFAGFLGFWVAGFLGCWVAGLLGCWVAGLLDVDLLWVVGSSNNQDLGCVVGLIQAFALCTICKLIVPGVGSIFPKSWIPGFMVLMPHPPGPREAAYV